MRGRIPRTSSQATNVVFCASNISAHKSWPGLLNTGPLGPKGQERMDPLQHRLPMDPCTTRLYHAKGNPLEFTQMLCPVKQLQLLSSAKSSPTALESALVSERLRILRAIRHAFVASGRSLETLLTVGPALRSDRRVRTGAAHVS